MKPIAVLLGTIVPVYCADPRREVQIMLEAAKAIEQKTQKQVEFFADPLADSFLVPRSVAGSSGPWFEGTKDFDMLAKLKISLSTESEEKCMHLFEFLTDRPDWFAATRRDILNLRRCFDEVVASRHAILATEKFEKFAQKILPLLYFASPELLARGAIDRDLAVESELDSHFDDLYQLHQIGQKLTESAADTPEDIVAAVSDATGFMSQMKPADKRYYDRLMSSEDYSDPVRDSLPQFMNGMLMKLAEAGMFESMVFLEQSFDQQFRPGIIEQEILFNSAYYGSSPNMYWLKYFKLFDTTPTWLPHVLRYMDQIYKNNASGVGRDEFRKCVIYDTSRKATDQIADIVRMARESPSGFVRMFDCILRHIWVYTNLKLPIPVKSGKPLYARTYGIIMLMARLGASPISFLISADNPASRIRANHFSVKFFANIDKSFVSGSFGRVSDSSRVPDLPGEFPALAAIIGKGEDCLYWLIFAEYVVDRDLGVSLVERFVERITTAEGAKYLREHPAMASYIERRIREVYANENELSPIPAGKNPKDFVFSLEALNIMTERGVTFEVGEVDALPPVLEFFFGGLRPILFGSAPKIHVTPRIGKLVLDALRPTVTRSEIHELCDLLSLGPHFEEFLLNIPSVPHRSYPFFVEMFDYMINDLLKKSRCDADIPKILTLFRLMAFFGKFDELDVSRFLISGHPPVSFKEWPASLMRGESYNIVAILLLDSYMHNKETKPSGVAVLDSCFSRKLFTDRKISASGESFPTMDNFVAFRNNLKTLPASDIIQMHRCFLYGLLNESIALPPQHGDIPLFRVTQLLLLMRMVTGAPAFLNM